MRRRTVPNSAQEQHFIEDGTAQEFKRCVLEHVTDCRVKQVAFWATFSAGARYNVGDIVYNTQNGAMTVMTNDGPTEILAPTTETTFTFTGTCTGAWDESLMQEMPSISSRVPKIHHRSSAAYQWSVDYDAAHSSAPR